MHPGEYSQQWEISSSTVCYKPMSAGFRQKGCLIWRIKASSSHSPVCWVKVYCKDVVRAEGNFFFLIYWFLHIPTCLQYLDCAQYWAKDLQKKWDSLEMAPWNGSLFTGAFPKAWSPAGIEVPSISQRLRQVPVVQNCLGNFCGKFCTFISTSVWKEK